MTHQRTPSYLLQRPSGFYFRYQIPHRFRSTVGCNELQLPLHINDTHKARHISTGMALTLKRTLETAMGTPLTKADLKRIAQHWKTRHLESMEADKVVAKPISAEAHEAQLTSIELLLSDLREQFALNNYQDLTDEAATLLDSHSGDPEYIHQLTFELAKVRLQALEQQTQLIKGRPVDINTSPLTTISPETDTEDSSTCISEAFKAYSAEKLRNSDWNPKTQQEHQYSNHLLQALLNDKAVSAISKADIRQIKETLARLPKNISKDKRFTGMSIREVIESEISQNVISTTRANQHLRLMSGFLGWCQLNGLMTENPITGMIPKRKRNARDERQQFTDQDVQALLTHPQVHQLNLLKPHQFWLPRLGMYTGARLEELCQLHTEDIIEIDDVFCIHINDSRDDQGLKNLQSPRIIPLHPSLIEAGFIDYIKKTHKDTPDGLIFPTLTKTKGKYSHNVSKWFSRVAKHVGLESGKTFHSYRHTMADKLRDQGAQDYVIKRILGHATQSETHDRYGSNRNANLLAHAIHQVSYR